MLKSRLALTLTAIFLGSLQGFAQSVAELKKPVTYRLDSFNINLDPAVVVDTQSRRIVDMLHARLVAADPRGEYRGEIADRWNWTSPSTLQLHLRHDLSFSNGKPITPRDVVWSLCRLLQPSAPYRWLFANVKHGDQDQNQRVPCTGLEAKGDWSVEIEVTTDPTRLLPALASSSAAIVPAESQSGPYGVVPGAGPYEVKQILANSEIILRPRTGGPLDPKASAVTFQLIQDDSSAATLFRAGKLDVIEIANPTLYRLLVGRDGRLTVPGRLIGMDADEIRLLIFNRAAIAQALGVANDEAQQWIRAVPAQVDFQAMQRRFEPLAMALGTSYFPARFVYTRPSYVGPKLSVSGRVMMISENDPYNDAIAAAMPSRIAGVDVDHVGVEKSVLISRLLRKEFDIALITLEAMLKHSAYWLSFFTPGSPFTAFGEPLQGLDLSGGDSQAALVANAADIDSRGNWLALFQERRYYGLQPRIGGETFLQTGLIDYATIGEQR